MPLVAWNFYTHIVYNKKVLMKITLLSGITALLIGFTASAQQTTQAAQETDRIGKMTVASFNSINAKGNQMVSAITPTNAPLSAADNKLMLKVAAGGQRQLAISQAVLEKVTNPQVKLLANSEVEEQTGVSAKLKEIAAAKGVTLPEGPDSEAQSLVSQVQNLSGAELDAFYVNQSGIKGHELLQATMTTVNSTAKDATLKKLATATLPVIKTHLSVSKDVKSMMGAGGNSTSSR